MEAHTYVMLQLAKGSCCPRGLSRCPQSPEELEGDSTCPPPVSQVWGIRSVLLSLSLLS